MPKHNRAPPASSPPATPPRTRHRQEQSSPAPNPAPSTQEPPASTLLPPPILANATVVLSSDKLEDLPCFDRASIGAAPSVNANRVWLPGQQVYLGILPLAEAVAHLAPLATTIPPLPNAENFHAALARGESIEHGAGGGDASPEFRAHLGKRVVAECVVRLAHRAGLLKKGEYCVILPTAGELEAFEPGSGGTSAGAQEEEEEERRHPPFQGLERQAPSHGLGIGGMLRRFSSFTLEHPEGAARRAGVVGGGAAQAVAAPARNSEHEGIGALSTQPKSESEPLCAMASADRDALITLFHETRGANWREKDNWGTSEVLGTWYGVDVNAEGRVVKLSLYNNNLQGLLPPELGKLGALEHLALDANWLSGSIPKQLGALTKLEKLLLYSNKLSGKMQ
ncbi:unnamed protein product [Ectocarpus sp. 6 AP-2014]